MNSHKLKSIRKESRIKRFQRALLVIEGLTMHFADDLYLNEGKPPTGKTRLEYILQLQRTLADIYCIAHSASGKCCEGGKAKWLNLITKNELALKKANIINISKCLNKRFKY